jgi:hypothetical protein
MRAACCASEVATVVAKSGLFASAVASSPSVSSVSGAELISAAISRRTQSVFAICCDRSPAIGVGAVGAPVKAGLAFGA